MHNEVHRKTDSISDKIRNVLLTAVKRNESNNLNFEVISMLISRDLLDWPVPDCAINETLETFVVIWLNSFYLQIVIHLNIRYFVYFTDLVVLRENMSV